ncbi:hypothetical protein IGS68_32490 (plasmid) [Skermanella sp. TT6]|uniref:Uncharacterized protein n=1 Tax=Skermanella cutis TaxID=2775420 RepID=A0ABX7BH61_9PROT|nr:hypothetical protein [Skermanella sp. TT6]QQP93732.1 hypothetical protein IGS68_32490 [Skermanella sp. TT6]
MPAAVPGTIDARFMITAAGPFSQRETPLTQMVEDFCRMGVPAPTGQGTLIPKR